MHNFHDKEKKKLLVFPKSLLDLQIQNFFLLYKYKICLAMFSKIPVQFTFLNCLPIQRVAHSSSADRWPPMAFPVRFVLLNHFTYRTSSPLLTILYVEKGNPILGMAMQQQAQHHKAQQLVACFEANEAFKALVIPCVSDVDHNDGLKVK